MSEKRNSIVKDFLDESFEFTKNLQLSPSFYLDDNFRMNTLMSLGKLSFSSIDPLDGDSSFNSVQNELTAQKILESLR